jgi:branched-subunit amino acid aminotransferase/4-amino-4-deoxychorismate lyase
MELCMVTQWMSIDGALVQASQAQLPAGLVTASQGQAWFETLRVMDQRVARGPRHVRRALRTAQMLGVQVPEAWLAWAQELADTLPPGLQALRVTFLTAPQRAHATVVCEARAVEPLLAPVTLLPVMQIGRAHV